MVSKFLCVAEEALKMSAFSSRTAGRKATPLRCRYQMVSLSLADLGKINSFGAVTVAAASISARPSSSGPPFKAVLMNTMRHVDVPFGNETARRRSPIPEDGGRK